MFSMNPRSLTFRTRTLLISSAVALAPFVLFATGVITEVHTSLLEKARSEQRAILTGVLQQIRGTLGGYEDLVNLLAKDKRIQSLQDRAVDDALHNFHRFNDFFVSTFIYDNQSRIRFLQHRNNYEGDSTLVGREASSFSERFARTIKSVIEGGECAYFDHIVDDETQSFLLFMAPIKPFTGEGKTLGVVSSAVQLYGHQFQELIDPIDLEGRSYCLILDRRNRVIARKGRGLPENLRAVDIDPLKPELGEKGITRSVEIFGRTDILSAVPLPALGCTLLVGEPKGEVLDFLTFLTTKIFTFGLFALVLGIFCALYLSRSLIGPILRLTRGIQKVGEGATSHRLPVEGSDELAQASEAFNRMAAFLQKSRLMERIWRDRWSDDSPDEEA